MQLDGLDPGELFAGIAHLPRIGLAVSGGNDSMALMLLVRIWCDLRGADAPEVFVYSVDHGLRPEAADEAEFVVRCAQDHRFVGRALVWSGDKPDNGVQAAARTARYRLIGAAMAADGVSVLLTAHHADDQAETVLMRMAHGSGTGGLGGMAGWSSVEGVEVHRPLLGLQRAQLEKIVRGSGISPVYDPSNSDPHYERVRWRQIAPELAKHGLTAHGLGRLAMRMQRADAALAQVAEEAFATSVSRDEFGVAHLPKSAFSTLPAEIGHRVLAQMFVSVGRPSPRLEQLEQLYADLGGADFAGVSLSGAQVKRGRDHILVFAEVGRLQVSPAELAPGETLEWDGRFVIENLGNSLISVRNSKQLTRAQAEQFLGGEIDLPMSALAVAPSVMDANGGCIALGLFTRSQEVRVTLQSVAQVARRGS